MDETELIRRAAITRGQPPKYSWDEACVRGLSYQGYGIDELLRHLLVKEAKATCSQCGAGDCTHEAARLVLWELTNEEQLSESVTTQDLQDAYEDVKHWPKRRPISPLIMPERGNRRELAIFRFGLLFGGSLGMTVGVMVATAIAIWSIYHSLPAAITDALRQL